MTRKTLTALSICAVVVTLGTTSVSALAADKDKVLATVAGESITTAQFEEFLANNELDPSVPQEKILNEIISRMLVLKDARKKGIDKSADFQRQLAQQQEQLLLNEALKLAVEENPITDKEIKELYDSQFGSRAGSEYKARHILIKEEKEGKDIIAKLDKGEDFATLAKQLSKGPSGKDGGDLGWFGPDQMVPPFSQAVQKMKKGAYTKSPVKTQFGWHVIKLDDTRALKPPPFDELEPRIKQSLVSQRIGSYLMKLRSSAKVEIK